LPATTVYFIAVNNEQAGPFDMGQLQEQVKAGRITRQTLVWKQGMSGWLSAEKVVELGGLFAAVPPALPKNG
jgi:hypothetical protein